MADESRQEDAAERISAALHKTGEERGYLAHVVEAFARIMVEQARWKAELTASECEGTVDFDPQRFAKGIPVSDRERLIRLGPLWRVAADRLITPLEEGFPKIGTELARTGSCIREGSFSPDQFLSAAFAARGDEAGEIAAKIGLEPDLLIFVLAQIAKPVVEKRAESLQSLIGGVTWDRGYCPICGSFPELSLLREKEGHRWLRCGFCASQWRFHRGACPFCDSRDSGDIEIFFVEGSEHERVEVCHKCKRYVKGIDTRNLAEEVVREVMDIGLMHLDAIAQEKGFQPMKGIGWNNPGSGEAPGSNAGQ